MSILFVTEFNNKIIKLKEWLSPLKTLQVFNIEALPGIIEQLKSFADDIIKLPRGLVILLRIIKHLAIAPPNDYPEGMYGKFLVTWQKKPGQTRQTQIRLLFNKQSALVCSFLLF